MSTFQIIISVVFGFFAVLGIILFASSKNNNSSPDAVIGSVVLWGSIPENEMKKTLEEIAAQQGVTLDTIADALYDAAAERLDEAVASGKITPDRADRIRPRLEERRDACANEGRCLPLPPPCRETGNPGN